jgi:hypothetical protein
MTSPETAGSLVRGKTISPAERDEANKTFHEAIKVYRRIAAEAPEGS